MRWGSWACAAAVLCACGEVDSGTGPVLEARRFAAGTPRYTIVEIPPLAGDDFGNAWALTERDQVAGASFGNGTAAPFLWEPRSGSRRLLDLTGAAVGLNESGRVAASGWACGGQVPHAFSARTDGTYQDIGTLGDPSGSCESPRRNEVFAINALGMIVGCSQRADLANRAYLYSDGQMVELPSLGGPTDPSCAFAINDRGQIAGQFAGSGPSGHFNPHAFLFEGGKMKDIGAGFGSARSIARAINNRGQVAGELVAGDSDLPGGETRHVFLYDQGVTRDLGGFGLSRVLAMNDRAQIVGGGGHGFLWENGQFHDLRSLVDDPTVTFFEGRAINDQGHIVASGLRGGRSALMLLVPPGPVVAVAALDGTPAQGYAPLWESFDGTRSYTTDPAAWITACRWSFGDGSADQRECWAIHAYAQAGTYTATLTVTDNLGREASSSITVEAQANPGAIPVVQYGPQMGPAPLAVFMDGTRSYASRPDSWVASCRWDFGDGSDPDTHCWALHTYLKPGQYTATFTVVDEQGAGNKTTFQIDAMPQ
jgi:probable HAF family extracellular repeat protein